MTRTSTLVDLRPGTVDGRSKEFINSTPLLDHPELLRQRGQEDGYLFFKGLLPEADVLEVRKDLLSVVDRYGWRKPGQDPLGGEIDLEALNKVPDAEMRDDIGVSTAAYNDVQRLESFHRLPHHNRMKALFRSLFQDEVLVHARHIARMVTGHRIMVPTPPHQDYPYIQGTSNTWTAWMPLGDCPKSMGGLSVLRGSDRIGYIPVVPSKGAGGFAVQTCPWETDWVESDYKVGDVLIFPSHTVHKALRTQHKEFIRLSLDVRYQALSEPVDPSSLGPHTNLDWEDIYAGWKADDLKYYWKKYDLKFSTWNQNFLKPARRIC